MADAITPNVPIAISASLKVDDVKVLARSTETVPDTANCVDQRIGLLAVDFATHAPDIDIDNICRGIEMKVPDVLQQHCPGYDAAFVANQILQKLEFPRKKHNVLPASAGGPPHQGDRDAGAQGLVAARGQNPLITGGRELFHEVTGGFRVVLNDQNTAEASRHGFPSPKDWPKAKFILAGSEAARLTYMSETGSCVI